MDPRSYIPDHRIPVFIAPTVVHLKVQGSGAHTPDEFLFIPGRIAINFYSSFSIEGAPE